MTKELELLRRALDVISYWSESKATDLIVEIRAFLAAEPEAEPDTWQDLTDEEIDGCKPVGGIAPLNDGYKVDGLWMYDFAEAIQASVQEKNHQPIPEPIINLSKIPTGSVPRLGLKWSPAAEDEADLSPPSGKGPFTDVDELIKSLYEADVNEPTDILKITYRLGLIEGKKSNSAKSEAEDPIDITTIAYQLGYQAGKKSRPEPARKPLPEKIDPILRTAGSMKYHPSYVAGWNNCIDAMSNGAEANAHLIAAAPELYAALEHIQIYGWDFDICEAALAKARGEE